VIVGTLSYSGRNVELVQSNAVAAADETLHTGHTDDIVVNNNDTSDIFLQTNVF